MEHIITSTQKHKIDEFCKYYKIDTYSINQDGSIDVDGDVNLSSRYLDDIEIEFNIVSGDFLCGLNRLISLRGCPKEVGGDFYCGNNELSSLEFCPSKIGGDFNCYSNKIRSLEFGPKEVGGDFNCSRNWLDSLEGCPKKINGNLLCYKNLITSLEGSPKEVGGDFNCYSNHLTTLLYCPNEITESIKVFGNNLSDYFYDLFDTLSMEERKVFMKYQKYYDVWLPNFNKEGMDELVAEIKDGLK
jgi:hypothetical protein